MTLEVLSHFGVDVAVEGDSLITIDGSHKNRLFDENLTFYADGDWSNAAFWLVAGAIGNNKIRMTGLREDSKQGDKAVIDILKRFGAKIEIEAASECERRAAGDSDVAGSVLRNITVDGAKLRGIEIDAADIPDLVPILSLAATCAEGTTRIYNAQRLRLKESDRLATVCELLSALGADITITEDGLIIKGKSNGDADIFRLKGGNVSSHNDHRIAMTAAIAATVCSDELTVMDSQAVNKSYPLFWQDYDMLNINKE
jgi:3-phosphoshikimate 1-carboxyvinyltransferase